MKQNQELFTIRKGEPKYNTILNRVILNIIKVRKLTFKQLSEMIFTTLAIKYPDESMNRYIGYRNHIIQYICGNVKLTYNKFEFIMNDILKENIPDDSDITHLKNLGIGKDLRGQKFGRLTVIECVGVNSRNNLLWKCRCSNIDDNGEEHCGKETTVISSSLISNKTQSCGCYCRERLLESNIKHGKCGSGEYITWCSMIERCSNHNNKSYKYYGGRGIIVCDRWRHSFENFYEDMGDRPEGMTIDREDNDGNYEPSNCRWATIEEQCYNKRTTPKFEDGTSVGLWSVRNNINYDQSNDLFHKGFAKNEILKKLSSKELSV